jgi:hypothetical protein
MFDANPDPDQHQHGNLNPDRHQQPDMCMQRCAGAVVHVICCLVKNKNPDPDPDPRIRTSD